MRGPFFMSYLRVFFFEITPLGHPARFSLLLLLRLLPPLLLPFFCLGRNR